jgi:hypothetical protein
MSTICDADENRGAWCLGGPDFVVIAKTAAVPAGWFGMICEAPVEGIANSGKTSGWNENFVPSGLRLGVSTAAVNCFM